jgi:putative hydrolase of the HAD superfamily
MEKGMKIELAIFDLGNVLFEIDFIKTIRCWSLDTGITGEKIRSRLIESGYYEKFEMGIIDPDEFFDILKIQLDINLPVSDIIKGWNALYGPVLEENYKAICEISKSARTVALTNTNKTHHDAWKEIYKNEIIIFEKIYLSSDLGMRKPDERIYRHVLSDNGVDAQNAVFFDDIDINIKSAAAIGINAVHVTGKDTISSWMKEHFRT